MPFYFAFLDSHFPGLDGRWPCQTSDEESVGQDFDQCGPGVTQGSCKGSIEIVEFGDAEAHTTQARNLCEALRSDA